MRKTRAELPQITDRFFDVRKILSGKNPRLAKMLPGMVFRFLERLIHQDDLNRFLYNNKDKWGADFARGILNDLNISVEVINEKNIPRKGRFLVVSNHPLGGVDGMALISELGSHREDILFPVNDLLMNIPNLYELFIPINKHGTNAENIQVLNDTFASDMLMLFFPAGLVSRKQNGQIRDLEWKKTFLTKARTYRRDIVPVHIGGRNSDFFYNLANLRKRMGIKANIEMLFLVDEMFKLKIRKLPITFGKPVPYTVFGRSKSDLQWAAELRQFVYELEKDPDAEFH